MIFTDLSGSKIEDDMTPLFTITTPNSQTIEGYDAECSYCGRTEICKGSYPEGCFLENDLLKPNSKLLKLSDITEEQAKEWGYNEKDLSEMEDGLFFTAKDVFVLAVTNEIKVTELDLSNILLILIEE